MEAGSFKIWGFILLVVFLLSFGVETSKIDFRSSVVTVDSLWNGKVYKISLYKSNQDSAVYHVFIPAGLTDVKGVFVHQHGCGMEGRGTATAYDVQYQSFAKKWGLAIVGPDLYFKNNCHDWREPSSGSGESLLLAIEKIGVTSGLSNLAIAPWLLWGHSGGGYWTLAMMKAYPERIMANVCYSPAFDPKADYPIAAAKIPTLIRHAGANDSNSPEGKCWITANNAFHNLRKLGGLVSIAHTPYQNHNFSDIRYIAIPFYEAVLNKRLSGKAYASHQDMLSIDPKTGWLADTLLNNTYPYAKVKDQQKKYAWLPDSLTASKWKEYVITGTIVDRTRPDAPFDLRLKRLHNVTVEVSWKADADIESGIRCFHIYRGNQLIGRFPQNGDYQNFDRNGDDALPMSNLPELRTSVQFVKGDQETLSICTVNHFGMESTRTTFENND